MRKRQEILKRFTPQGIPFVLIALLAALLAALYCYSSTFFFAFQKTEYLNRLLALPQFWSSLHTQLALFVLPWQNLNLYSFLWFKTMPAASGYAVWLLIAGQMILAWLLLSRTKSVLEDEFSPDSRSLFFVLLACHPLLWTTLITAPSLVLTAWLLIEALAVLPQAGGFLSRWFAFLLLLSLSGEAGVICAVALAGGQIVWQAAVCQSLQPASARIVVVTLAAIAPSMVFVGLLTIQSGILGGPYLNHTQPILPNLSPAVFFNGEWSRHLQANLMWIGHGFLHSPIAVPLFGLLVLLGLGSAWETQAHCRGRYFAAGMLMLLFVGLHGFVSPSVLQNRGLLLLFPSMLFALHGIQRVGRLFNHSELWVNLGMVTLFGFLAITQFPRYWQTILHRAVFYENLVYTLQQNRKNLPQSMQVQPRLPMRFSLPVYGTMANFEGFWPYEFALMTHPQGVNTHRQPFHIGLPLEERPSAFVAYPTFEEAQIHGLDYLPEPYDHPSIPASYERIQIQNLSVFLLNDAPPAAERLPVGELKGQQWFFGRESKNARRIGLAFPITPALHQGEFGLGHTSTSSREGKGSQGTVLSYPFVIEGNELRVSAQLPQQNHAAVICLALYESVRFGDDQTVRKAKHIYEHEPGEPLREEVFYYLNPAALEYLPGWIRGWRVVRVIHSGERTGAQEAVWSLDPWRNRQARWMAADRDSESGLWIGKITQHLRPPGFYWNFEDGTYQGWEKSGNAWGEAPAQESYGEQNRIRGHEGNYLINSYYQGSDWPIGVLSRSTIEPLSINLTRMSFLIGGGEDIERLYVALVVDGRIVKKATGRGNETLRRVIWDISPWVGKVARIQIVDRSSDAWGHLLVDDVRLYQAGSEPGQPNHP